MFTHKDFKILLICVTGFFIFLSDLLVRGRCVERVSVFTCLPACLQNLCNFHYPCKVLGELYTFYKWMKRLGVTDDVYPGSLFSVMHFV
jgi:hypothetical protein